MASMNHVNLLDPETSNVVSREKARQAHASRRSRSKSRDRLSAIRSLSSSKGEKTPRALSPTQRALSPTQRALSPTQRGSSPIPRAKSPAGRIGDMWRRVAGIALRWSRGHYRDHLRVTGREHMSDVDCFDGDRMRKGDFQDEKAKQSKDQEIEELSGAEEDLVVIHPLVDGRLKDEGRK
ncbi:hypothetical protein C8Q77DRAFT_555675 [Trametes polyzona]|nr:hypothetical protein C8Q77DRAFT_555675 [Trametes polyzona]